MAQGDNPGGSGRRAGPDATTRAFRAILLVFVAAFGGYALIEVVLAPAVRLLIAAGDLSALPEDPDRRALSIRISAALYVALIGALLAIWRSWIAEKQTRTAQEQARIAQRALDLNTERSVTESFTKAIELLGAADKDGRPILEQRLGAIYALERIARENVESYHIQIMETLCAYVREHRNRIPVVDWPGAVVDRLANDKTGDEIERDPAFKAAVEGTDITHAGIRDDRAEAMRTWKAAHPTKLLREDLRAIMDVIARRGEDQRTAERRREYRPDFRRTNFQFIEYSGAAFAGAALSEARFEGAILYFASFDGADLSRARMAGAGLYATRLGGTILEGTNLERAELRYSYLSGTPGGHTTMIAADLRSSMVGGNALRSVDLRPADLDDGFLANTFGDASVVLPDGTEPPAQWERSAILNDEAFFGRWRGWLEVPGGPPSGTWPSIAPPGFEDIPPIQPPKHVSWSR